MKKLVVTVLACLGSTAALALPIGNPADPTLLRDGLIWEGHCIDLCDPCLTWCEAFSFRVGFYGDYVFNRKLELNRRFNAHDIRDTELFTNAALLVANIYEKVDVFLTLGGTSLTIDANAQALGIPNLGNNNHLEIETRTGFSWSLGARATLWDCGCTSLGAEAQYLYTKPDIKRVTLAGSESVYVEHGIDAKYREWQVGVAVSHRIHIFVPYLGVKWSRAILNMDKAIIPFTGSSATLFNMRNKNDFGYAVGVTIVSCDIAIIGVEGRFGDEKAVYVNGQVRF